MGKLQRYFWPKTALLFSPDGDTIDAAFGFVEKDDIDIVERRTIDQDDKTSLAEWYREIVRTYPKTYAAAMLDTINQGALPGCGKAVFATFGVETALVQSLCIDESWEVYASLVEMKWFEQKFREIDLDLAYSPFVLLYTHSQAFLEENPGLFLLHQEGVAYLMVLSKKKMWYAQILIISKEAEEGEETLDESENEEEIEGLAFDLEEISADTEVEPISDVDVLTDFKEEIGKKETGPVSETALELLEYNLNLFESLKEAIARFYHDDRYPHEFIEKVTIFDTASLEEDLIRYIEDELFMEASLHRFDAIKAMSKLVAREIGS